MEQKQIWCGLVCNYPWLVAQNLDDDDDAGLQSFYTVHDPLSPYVCRIPELLGRRIRGCFHNWVILSNHPYNVMWSLWNPMTTDFIGLPPLSEEGDFDDIGYCCLSSPPDDPSSILLLMGREKPNIFYCKVVGKSKSKSSRWCDMSYAKQLKKVTGTDDCILQFPTCSNGKVYALGMGTGYIIQLDIVVKDKDILISLIPFKAYHYSTYNAYPSFYLLKGSNSELFCISVCFDSEATETLVFVSLFKLDMNNATSEWEEIEDLKDDVFFVDISDISDIRDIRHAPSSVFYYRAIPSEELQGHIYIRGRLGNVIYSYNVKDRTVSLTPMIYLERKTHVSLWECDHILCSLEGDNGIAKYTINNNNDEPRPITDAEVESPLLNIPFHLLEMIMQFCVGIEYMYFRSTCKRCNLAAPMIRWSNKQALVTYSPWLMVLEYNRGIMHFTDPIFGDKYFMKTLPVSVHAYYDKSMSCSKYGWLLFYSNLEHNRLVFFNPFTRDVHLLPTTPHILKSVCFSAPPTSSSCIVVGFGTQGDPLWYTYILSFANKDPSWCIFQLDYDFFAPSAFNFSTFCDHDLYALCDEQLVVFKNITQGRFSRMVVVVEAPKYDLKFMTRYFLVKRDEHLLLVTVGRYGEFVEVFQLNDSTKEWNRINCLGQHMIYICSETCLCIEAKTPKMKNKVYFARMHSHNDKIVFYSLETSKFHTFNGQRIEATWGLFFETKHHLYPHIWIEPSWN